MAFDSFFIRAANQEINMLLSGLKVGKIYQPERRAIIMRFNGREGHYRLLLSANTRRPRFHFCGGEYKNPVSPPLFCMVLRKYLEGSKFIAVSQQGMERIVVFKFLGRNELGDGVYRYLIMEIMGKHSNIILTDETNTIIDGIFRYSHALSRHREVLPGRAYVTPPVQYKKDFRLLNTSSLGQIFYTLKSGTSLEEAMKLTAEGFSPQMIKELLIRADLSPSVSVEEMGEYELSRVLNAAQDLLRIFDREEFSPTVLLTPPGDFAALPLSLWENSPTANFASPSDAARMYYEDKEKREVFAVRKNNLLKHVENHYNRLNKKIRRQKDDLKQAESGEIYRLKGETLSVNLYALEKGAAEVILENIYEQGSLLSIAMNPALSPKENMGHYFKLYGKAKHAREEIKTRLAINEDEFAYIDSVLNAANHVESEEELEEIEDELTKEGYLKKARIAPGKGQKKPVAPPLPPRIFSSDEGFDILVGRNNKQNDRLTLKIAAANDIWLHTKDIQGSHVIIRSNGAAVSENTLLKAASLAARFSRAYAGGKVPVDYTAVSQVKKPHGAKPGMVIYFHQKTIMAEPAKLYESENGRATEG
jgi:predicted ribosome quality control (RQC) complex YloA/Tae2 family protein